MAKILVVDDDKDIRRLVKTTLQDTTHQLWEAGSGEEAIEIIEERRPDLMILDIMMPGMDGMGVLRELRRRNLRGRMRVLILTAKTQESDFVAGYKLGADEYVTKPFDPDELALAVTETLMLSDDQLQKKRDEEIERARILSRLESLFGDDD